MKPEAIIAFPPRAACATTVYLVAQVSVADLRNANRFVTRYFGGIARDKLEIVLNRLITRNVEIDETAINKSLDPAGKVEDPERLHVDPEGRRTRVWP